MLAPTIPTPSNPTYQKKGTRDRLSRLPYTYTIYLPTYLASQFDI